MATTMRAAIMLAVLVGGPAAWMYCGPLPDNAQRVVDRFVTAAKEAIDWDEHLGKSRQTASKPRAARGTVAAPGVTRPVAEATSPGTGSLEQQVEPLLAQLRQFGVAEYALEPWGADHQMFRFHCEMPLAGGVQSTEEFEAIAADPRASIERVVADVSMWKSQRVAMASR